jgi:hypothetical protein
MKKGIFTLLNCLYLASLISLSSCASLLSYLEEDNDPATLDRGYAAEESTEEEDCAGRFCRSAEARAKTRELASVSREESRLRRAIGSRDVILGMTRQHVMESWGEPVQREVAGRGMTGNERWTYGSRFSLQGSRTVIFENGRVAGWER